MIMKLWNDGVWYDGEKVGEILTNRSLSLEDCFDILGIDITEQVGGDPVWDYDLFEMRRDLHR